jgi:hypothetical protein
MTIKIFNGETNFLQSLTGCKIAPLNVYLHLSVVTERYCIVLQYLQD